MRKSVPGIVLKYLKADTSAKRQAFLDAHPELLGPAADAELIRLIDLARTSGQADIAMKLQLCRNDLAQARAARRTGPPDPGPASSGGGAPPPVPAAARPLLAQLTELGPEPDPGRQAALLRQLMPMISEDAHRELWLALQCALGNALANLARQGDPGIIEEAISALETVREALPPDAAGKRRMSGHQLGGLYLQRQAGSPGENIERTIRCLSEAVSPGDEQLPSRERAGAQAGLAEAYLRRTDGNRAGNIERAIEYLHAAAETFTQESFPAEWAALQVDLGAAYRERLTGDQEENTERAIRHCQAALAPNILARDSMEYARALNGLGLAYGQRFGESREKNLERAIGCFLGAQEILSALGRDAEYAAAAHNLGWAYIQRIAGNPAENIESALGCLQDALSTRVRLGMAAEAAEARHALGSAYLIRGRGERAQNFELAISEFREAEAAFMSLPSARHVALVQLVLGQAYANRVLGDREDNLRQAVACLKAALTAFADQGMVLEQAGALSGLGNAVAEQNAPDRAPALRSAIGYHRQALAVLSTHGGSPDARARALNNLGTAYLERSSVQEDDLGSAISCFTQSLAAGTAQTSPLEQAQTRYNLGVAHAARAALDHPDDLRDAITQFTAALREFSAIGFAPGQRACAQALGDAYARLGGHWPDAVTAYTVALDAADEMYASSLARAAREAELEEAKGLHARAAYAMAMTGDLEQAVVTLELGRARGLGESLARDTAELADIDSQLADEFTGAAAELRELESTDWGRVGRARAAAGLLPAGQPGDSNQGSGRLRQQLEAARTRLLAAIRQIRDLEGHSRFLMPPRFGDIAELVSQAGPVAYLAATVTGSLTLLLTNRGGTQERPLVERIGEAQEPLTSEALTALLIRRNSDGDVTGGYLPAQAGIAVTDGEFEDELAGLLPALGERLIAPLARALARDQAGNVVLIACGLLGLLPLHAATYRAGRTVRCLLDDFAVSYVPSARVLATARSMLPAEPAVSPVLAGVGDPAGGTPLEFSRAELAGISAYFREPRVFYGEEATRSALLSAAAGADYVHFSCHGRFDPTAPRDSALMLAGPGLPDPLTLSDVVSARPFAAARLVVASACETAVTDFTGLPDESIGLPAGFLQGGTPAMVGTLWSVADISTALLITRFFEFHLGCGDQAGDGALAPDKALRRAQRWLARATSGQLEDYVSRHDALADAARWLPAHEQPFSHPYFWAPFVLVGA